MKLVRESLNEEQTQAEANMWYQKRFGWQDIEIPEGYDFSGISTWGSGHQSPYIEKIGAEYSKGVMIVGSDEMGYELINLADHTAKTITVPTKQEALDKTLEIIERNAVNEGRIASKYKRGDKVKYKYFHPASGMLKGSKVERADDKVGIISKVKKGFMGRIDYEIDGLTTPESYIIGYAS